MSILSQEIANDPLALGYANGNIEQLINEKRFTRLVEYELGKGDVLNVLDLPTANALCDLIDNTSDFRHVKYLFANGKLRIDFPKTQAILASLVGVQIAANVVFSQDHVNAINALASKPCSRAEQLGLGYVTDRDIMEAQ